MLIVVQSTGLGECGYISKEKLASVASNSMNDASSTPKTSSPTSSASTEISTSSTVINAASMGATLHDQL